MSLRDKLNQHSNYIFQTTEGQYLEESLETKVIKDHLVIILKPASNMTAAYLHQAKDKITTYRTGETPQKGDKVRRSLNRNDFPFNFELEYRVTKISNEGFVSFYVYCVGPSEGWDPSNFDLVERV